MKVIVATENGFCDGAKNAYNAAMNAGAPAWSYGDLLHNPHVIASLKARGIHSLNEALVRPGDTVITRAHGISPQEKARLMALGLNIIDATCPIIKGNLERAKDCICGNLSVIIIGKRNHPEVEMLQSALNAKILISTVTEIENLSLEESYLIIGQSSFNADNFNSIVAKIRLNAKKALVLDTLCPRIKKRLEGGLELASKVGAMIVVGGRNSSNTNLLFELCKKKKPAFLVEGADEISDDMVKGISCMGVISGTSTPMEIVDEVVNKLKAF